MADLTLNSYDLNGKKLSFANWISNLSPTETPFVSMTKKEPINQTLFQWQTDTLEAAKADNAVGEGSVATDEKRLSTTQMNNVTQILRKVVKVSDTSNALANYGRGQELKYQMEKAGKEIKRDLELTLLSAQEMDVGGTGKPRKTACFTSLVAPLDEASKDTGAVVHLSGTLDEETLFKLTYNIYLAGSEADVIMFHPKHAMFFSSLMERSDDVVHRLKMFKGKDIKFNKYISTLVDPLGRTYKLIPNRWMPEDRVYVFCANDWTQMVLREPERTLLAKDGSYQKWMIELETGLRHKNPYASAVLEVEAAKIPVDSVTVDPTDLAMNPGESKALKVTVLPADATNKKVTYTVAPTGIVTVDANGNVKAVKAGNAVITIKTVDGGKTVTVNVVVTDKPVAVTGVHIDPTEKGIEVGGTFDFKAVVEPAEATNKKVTWTIADQAKSGKASRASTVASVDATGKVTGLAVGTAIVTATTEDGKKTGTATLTVSAHVEPVKSVELDKATADLKYDETVQLTAKVLPENATDKAVTWKSDKPEFATVDAKGKVTAMKVAGKATITVTTHDGSKTANCVVTVSAPAVKSVVVDPKL